MKANTAKPVAWLVIADEKAGVCDCSGRWRVRVPQVYLTKREAKEDVKDCKYYARNGGSVRNIIGPIPLIIDPKWQEDNK